MKIKLQIVLYIILIALIPSLGFAAQPTRSSFLNEFYLNSTLGNRILQNQIQSTLAPSQNTSVKSPTEAFLYSLVIPGLGQISTGKNHGYFYTAAEAGLWVTYFILRNNAVNTREEYRNVVRDNVNFEGPGNFEQWDTIEDFEHATQYENWNHVYDSPATQDRTGKWYWKDLDPTLKNEKDSTIVFDSKFRLEAFELRQKANDTFQNARTILGLVILNHVVSAVEARINTKRWNLRQLEEKGYEIDTSTDISSGTLTSILVLRKRF